ncbi:hypothetical protein PInf_018693 [Phytophthora infestans]|nr:hypothetical protein PInf_018693 [Phytophthora infestans]
MDEALTRIAPKKELKRRIQIPIPTVQVDEDLYVLSFDGSARVRGEIDCKAPALTLLRQKVMVHLRGWMNHELVHVKRDWNASADSLASAALRNQCGVEVEREAEHQDLVTLNRLDEVVVVGSEKKTVQGVRIERTLKAQNEEAWILGLKKYLMGDGSGSSTLPVICNNRLQDRTDPCKKPVGLSQIGGSGNRLTDPVSRQWQPGTGSFRHRPRDACMRPSRAADDRFLAEHA